MFIEHQCDICINQLCFRNQPVLTGLDVNMWSSRERWKVLGSSTKAELSKVKKKLLLLEPGIITPNLICQKSTCPSDSGKLLTTLDRAKGKRECLAQNDSPLMVAPSRGPEAKRLLIYLFIHL